MMLPVAFKFEGTPNASTIGPTPAGTIVRGKAHILDAVAGSFRADRVVMSPPHDAFRIKSLQQDDEAYSHLPFQPVPLPPGVSAEPEYDVDDQGNVIEKGAMNPSFSKITLGPPMSGGKTIEIELEALRPYAGNFSVCIIGESP